MAEDDDPLAALTLYVYDSDSDTPPPAALRAQKLHQTESHFQQQKLSWRPVDDILLSQTRLTLPLSDSSLTPEILKIRAEQEHYLRRYEDALKSSKEALRRIGLEASEKGEMAKSKVEEGVSRELRELVERCEAKIGSGKGEP